MAMEVEAETSVTDSAKLIDSHQIINCLTNNEKICFKSQQRGESDLTKVEKTNIATEMYNQNKLNFLVRFGKYLEKDHLVFFEQFSHENDEIKLILNNLQTIKKDFSVDVKNRRYQALKQMIEKNSYFSEIEMMKRNPLLYEQLVGQYLTEEEKMERDRIEATEETTLVKVLMEGIERDDAKIKKKEQEEREDEAMEEDDEDDDDDKNNDSDSSEPDPSYTQWGEFIEDRKVIHIKKTKSKEITLEEQELLKEEFITSMYQNFLDGKDEDFDYDSVDNNDKYDNVEMKDYDEEDKYFDSEEPETLMPDKAVEQESSEDELDIFMSALNQNPAVSKLSKDIEKL